MKKMKKVIAVLMAALTVGASGMAVSADNLDYAVDDELGLYYIKADSANSYISISNKKATCRSVVRGKSSVTKIYVQQILQKKIQAVTG